MVKKIKKHKDTERLTETEMLKIENALLKIQKLELLSNQANEEKNKILMEILNDLYWKNETYITRANLSFHRFPDKFYGIGNNTSLDDEENYTPKLYRFEFGLMRQIIPHLYGGLRYFYENYTLIEIEPDGRLASGTILGTEGGNLSGLGIYLNWDSRDNIFYAKSGYYLEIS